MKVLESFSVLEAFGLNSTGNGLFTEISELDFIDVTGGSCGSGGGGWWICYSACGSSYYIPSPAPTNGGGPGF